MRDTKGFFDLFPAPNKKKQSRHLKESLETVREMLKCSYSHLVAPGRAIGKDSVTFKGQLGGTPLGV